MTQFQRKNWIQKFFLRATDYEDYKNYKFMQALNKVAALPNLERKGNGFKHSGNAGDIIYSLPAALCLSSGEKARFFLKVGERGRYGKKPHPLGNVMLNERVVTMLEPLLVAQPGISECSIWEESSPVDYDLDLIRDYPFPLKYGNIARWYFHVFAVNADLGMPWLHVDPEPGLKDRIVLARSQRHRAPGIDYSFLNKYQKTLFIGLEEEWKDMKEMVPGIEFRPVNDFLEMARVIAGSGLFIGNQSFPFSLAEALKVRRILEVSYWSPNVMPEGPEGFDTCYQRQLEVLVSRLAPGEP